MLHLQVSKSIWVEAGDLFAWLEDKIEHMGEIIWDASNQVWTFIVKIGDQIYSAVLNCVEAVVSAIQVIYNAIVSKIEDLIDFLKNLFDLDDIKRTKNVIENITKLFLQHQVDQIEMIKKEFNHMIDEAEKAINNWSGSVNLAGLGTGITPINQLSKPPNNNSAPGDLLSYHFQHNARNATMYVTPPAMSPPGPPMEVLIKALLDEWDILGDTFDAIYELVGDIGSMSVEDLVKRLIAIIGGSTLESVKIVIDALLDVIYDMAKSALEIFETPIHIPVISDILEDFGVPEFSFLDIICWVGAVPVTIAYKLAEGEAPFADNEETKALINAASFTSLAAQFPGSQSMTFVAKKSVATPILLATAGYSGLMGADERDWIDNILSKRTCKHVFFIFHVAAAAFGFGTAMFKANEAAQETGGTPLAHFSTVFGIIGACWQGGANFLVPTIPINNAVMGWLSIGTTGIRILSSIAFGSLSLSFVKIIEGETSRRVGAIVDAVLGLPALACSIWHFCELAEAKSNADRTKAILDESSNVASYLTSVSYAMAVNSEAQVKYAAAAFVATLCLAYSGLQQAEATLELG